MGGFSFISITIREIKKVKTLTEQNMEGKKDLKDSKLFSRLSLRQTLG